MVGLSGSETNPGGGMPTLGGWRVGLPEPGREREAVALLLTGRPRPEEPSVDGLLGYLQEQGLGLETLRVAWQGGRAVAAAILLPMAGRTAIVMLSPLGRGLIEPGRLLVEAVCQAADRKRVKLVQALLDPWKTHEREAFELAGLKLLADLHYMERRLDRPRRVKRASQAGQSPSISPTSSLEPWDVPPGLELSQWRPELRDLFARAILASYEQTLDCPGLVGMRSIDDIIDGHQASGLFDPALWTVVHRGEEPAGVMLLAELPSRDAVELVYLGLAPAWRGRGLGRGLLSRGLGETARLGRALMLLAVDSENIPARRLYEARGFAVTMRKLAMIMALA